jgi:hypothetical protein
LEKGKTTATMKTKKQTLPNIWGKKNYIPSTINREPKTWGEN